MTQQSKKLRIYVVILFGAIGLYILAQQRLLGPSSLQEIEDYYYYFINPFPTMNHSTIKSYYHDNNIAKISIPNNNDNNNNDNTIDRNVKFSLPEIDPFETDLTYLQELIQNYKQRQQDTNIGKTFWASNQKHFCACLLIMDDNHLLVEWLAYHYHILPLRRLIVGIDINSQTSPQKILDRYQGLINITVWTNDTYFPMDKQDQWRHNKLKMYLLRQQFFYNQCLKEFKNSEQNHTWVAVFDTDEYVLPNYRASELFRYQSNIIQQTTQNISNITHPRLTIHDLLQPDRIPPRAKAHSNLDPIVCMSIARKLFGVHKSPMSKVFHNVPKFLDDGKYNIFNPMDFLTLRYRFAGKLPNTSNTPGKTFVDISNAESIGSYHSADPHNPLRHYCQGRKDTFKKLRYSPLIIHHYVGTLEQYLYRNDSRRSLDLYRLHDFAKDPPDDKIRFWLSQFVNEMGKDLAIELLRGVGKLQPKK